MPGGDQTGRDGTLRNCMPVNSVPAPSYGRPRWGLMYPRPRLGLAFRRGRRGRGRR